MTEQADSPKMKCEVDGDPPCRRCRHTKAACVFRPRSNAASAIHDVVALHQGALNKVQDIDAILGRLDRIESALGISKESISVTAVSPSSDQDEDLENLSLRPLWKAVKHLRKITRPDQDEAIWSRPVIKHLWHSFLNNLPLLHFLKDQSAFASPSPLLLASVLFISALHGPSRDLSEFTKGYFVAQCCAITELVNPDPLLCLRDGLEDTPGGPGQSLYTDRSMIFHNILGLIMASLSSEAYVPTTGMWIAIAYRLLLDHTPRDVHDTTLNWAGLFSGLQVIDIEHASMHMCCPLLPEQPPIPALAQFNAREENAFHRLIQMMHHGLSHFVGRGLPTIWSFVSAREREVLSPVRMPFTDKDGQVIRLWARKLDDWLVRYNVASQPSPSDRQGILILLQYHLHKLYVLSIYHPARGFDLGSTDIAPAERHELLVSARAVLRLRLDDASIWSNWDLIMVTFAAMLLLRGIEDGMSHQDDLLLIEKHIDGLKRDHPSIPSIHNILANRLESGLQSMHTPQEIGSDFAIPGPGADYSWAIFDQEILSLANPPWLLEGLPVGEVQKPDDHQSGLSARYDYALTQGGPNAVAGSSSTMQSGYRM
ncbi:hypothetical protein BO94DRAFT_347320 [Aspergillus sclerotioniger CBS 115572]|uniref:Zn(2)-C6 fungal-type domain-containing protein n=1 Tax=Aspergillus sclerotioniger CBS 115572 TaxID=1450535 RepID=A0A317X7S4_9EURO|nr:hypothetical protein BO94DRAFT_347320 [Aspergillus sclerotioniger CBS 115572]PWY93607.1 hypothetical protein BO94DRAFT_347320 [Aspergillus sclerotioniger CBS 115572]